MIPGNSQRRGTRNQNLSAGSLWLAAAGLAPQSASAIRTLPHADRSQIASRSAGLQSVGSLLVAAELLPPTLLFRATLRPSPLGHRGWHPSRLGAAFLGGFVPRCPSDEGLTPSGKIELLTGIARAPSSCTWRDLKGLALSSSGLLHPAGVGWPIGSPAGRSHDGAIEYLPMKSPSGRQNTRCREATIWLAARRVAWLAVQFAKRFEDGIDTDRGL